MTTEHAPDAPDAPDPEREDAAVAAFSAMMGRIIRRTVVFGVTAGALLCVAGFLVSGRTGLWGALTGAAVGGLYLTVTLVAGRATRTAPPTTTLAVMLGSFLAKVILLFVVLLVVRDREAIDQTWLLVSVLLVVAGMMTIEIGGLLSARRQPLRVSLPEVDDDGNPLPRA